MTTMTKASAQAKRSTGLNILFPVRFADRGGEMGRQPVRVPVRCGRFTDRDAVPHDKHGEGRFLHFLV